LIYIRRRIDISLGRSAPAAHKKKEETRNARSMSPVFWLKIPLKDKKKAAVVTLPLRAAHPTTHTRRPRCAADYDVAIRSAARGKQKVVFH
jgi:hypothetical protein